jgi:hypothetical protein
LAAAAAQIVKSGMAGASAPAIPDAGTGARRDWKADVGSGGQASRRHGARKAHTQTGAGGPGNLKPDR